MIANHIHDALEQVRRLQELILDKRAFTGYSGTARMLGGTAAFLGCAIMSLFRNSPAVQLSGWALILIITLLLNYGALLLWFCQRPPIGRTWTAIRPAFDAIPPLAVGAVLTLALVLNEQLDLLFGSWMCLYGLAHTAYRPNLPRSNWLLGCYYILCGTFFLTWPGTSFMNPLPAGIVFLVGEWIGGGIFYRHKVKAMGECCDEQG